MPTPYLIVDVDVQQLNPPDGFGPAVSFQVLTPPHSDALVRAIATAVELYQASRFHADQAVVVPSRVRAVSAVITGTAYRADLKGPDS